ncbi:hypothetical protein F53441_8045 [Fusarium austroafricanum]|uniref:Heterokaryon incompatibility domain-containing protein n=1 Tax=Fusarium austroafricanum TaxID=2364996 RepID=A0A8H4KF95_9HYPO|nr:hypothetical protein F53441_8045 [Fusarium austroafricanum]
MRLLDAKTLEVVEFMDHNVPKYVILSHTWVTGQEVTFQDMQNKEGTDRSGYDKIRQACALALENKFGYAWVDTCCIDKTSSAELSEAINSMMSWYERSEICYTYLADVPPGTDIREPESPFVRSRWFKRGWTLQELLAPSRLVFLFDDWTIMCERDSIVDVITQITGIDQAFLSAPPTLIESNTSRGSVLQYRLHSASIAEKMSWASKRETTRIEDTAYSLLGIFGINMPLLYGEGANAFLRLQEEIMKHSDDQTLLAWSLQEDDPEESGVLATSPAAFSECKDFIPCDVGTPTPPFQITNKGLRIEMPISSDSFIHGKYGLLQCRTKQDPTTMIAIPLDSGRNGLYVRRKKPLCNLNYQYWSEWALAAANLLPSFSFTSGITESPSYTVFLKDLPETFYIAEVYPPNSTPQPDPRIVMTGTPDSKGEFEEITMLLLKSSTRDVEPLVIRIIVELALDESDFDASCTFVENFSLRDRQDDLGEHFYDNVSLASSWRRRKTLAFPYWTGRREASYTAGCRCEHHFGKTLVLASVKQEGMQAEGVVLQRGPDMIFHDWDAEYDADENLPELKKGWEKTLQRLSYHCRNSLRSVVRSLALSPWIFGFVVDRLIMKAFIEFVLAIVHIWEHWKAYAVGGGTALCLSYNRVLVRWMTWQIRKMIHAIPFARRFSGLQKTDALDFFLLYICCKWLPSELLSAVLEKDYTVLLGILLGCGFRRALADNGLEYNYCLGLAEWSVPKRQKR